MSVARLDRTDPEGEIAAAARRCSNWGRWGTDDVLGTMNFLDEAKRLQAAGLVRRGVSCSLSQRFDMDGLQKGWRRRTKPGPHDARHRHRRGRRNPGLPARDRGCGRRRVDAAAVPHAVGWVGHVFDRGIAWAGGPRVRSPAST